MKLRSNITNAIFNNKWKVQENIKPEDSDYINLLRGFCIIIIMLLHLGLSWFCSPYSDFIISFVALFFFISGGVSYFSFKKSSSVFSYFVKRFFSLAIPFYMVGLISLFAMIIINNNIKSLTFKDVINWMTFYTNANNSPYSIGQSWYLHALFFITLISVPIFVLSEKTSRLILIGIFISLVLGVIQFINPIHRLFFFKGHNFYQAFANLNFFLFGTFYYRYRSLFNHTINLIFLLCFSLIVIVFLIFSPDTINLSYHSYSPDIYYFSCCYLAIFICLNLQKVVQELSDLIPILREILLFFNKNAFSIFLLHSLMIDFVESQFGLVNVASKPILAIIKILFVITTTILISPLFTRICSTTFIIVLKIFSL